MATVKAVLRKDKIRGDGTAPLFLRITENRKSRYVKLDFSIEPKLWNPKAGKVRKSHHAAVAMNAAIERDVTDAKLRMSEMKRHGRPTADTLKDAVALGVMQNVFDFGAKVQADYRTAGKLYEVRKIITTLGKLEKMTGGRSLTLSEIDRDFLRRFDEYMRVHMGNAVNTRRKNLQVLGRMLKKAVAAGIVEAWSNPFNDFKIESEPAAREKLTLAQIKAIEAVHAEPGSRLFHAKNAFLFSFYTAGLRFGDLCRLRWKDHIRGERLVYRMHKNAKPKSIKLFPQALGILEHYRPANGRDQYIFPFLEERAYAPEIMLKRIGSMNALINRELKNLAALAGITDVSLSTHLARHSFADIARKSGMSVYSISKALAHSSLSMTEKYLRGFDEELLDEEMGNVFM